MSEISCHRVKFFTPQPSAINSLAYEPQLKQLAVGRSNNRVEIYDTTTFCFLKVFHIAPPSTVESVLWSNGQLLSVGLDGVLHQFDGSTSFPTHSIKIAASAVWCCCNSPKDMLAAGSEDGNIVIMSQTGKLSVEVVQSLPKLQTRILSICWSKDGEFIVTGTVDMIHIWSYSTRRCVSRLTLRKENRQTETLVWCLNVTSDFTIVSGDSTGTTSFWNGKNGTLMKSYKSHRGDVLCVCVNEEKRQVLSTGVDPVVSQFVRYAPYSPPKKSKLGGAEGGGNSDDQLLMWIEGIQMHLHTHSVRAACIADDYLVTGGVDSIITFSKYPPKTVKKILPHFTDRLQLNPESKLLTMAYDQSIQLWKLGEFEHTAANGLKDGQMLPLTLEPSKLVQLSCKDNRRIVASALSNDAKYLAYCDSAKTILYRISFEEDNFANISMAKVRCLNTEIKMGSTLLLYSSNGVQILLVCDGKQFTTYEIDDIICQMKSTFTVEGCQGVTKMVFHPANQLVAVCYNDCSVALLDVSQEKLVSVLPRRVTHPVGMQFTNESLFVCYADFTIVEFDLTEMSYSKWSRTVNSGEENLPKQLKSSCPNNQPLGITVDLKSASLLLYTDAQIVRISLKLDNEDKVKFSVVSRFNRVTFVDTMADSLVLVEVDGEKFQSSLPERLYVKRFGTG